MNNKEQNIIDNTFVSKKQNNGSVTFKKRTKKSIYQKDNLQQETINLKKKIEIINKIILLRSQEESLHDTFKKFKILQDEWKKIGSVPILKKEHIWKTYNHHIELFYDYIKINKELRDLDFNKNLKAKQKICESAKKLIKEKSINKMFMDLQILHQKWKKIGPVTKNERENIWKEFQKYTYKIHNKRNKFFLNKKKIERRNLEKKNLICKEIKLLVSNDQSNHVHWQNITDKISSLTDEWKRIAPINKNDLKGAWSNLRESKKTVYSERNQFFKKKKQNLKKNLNIKIRICEKAEELSKSNEWNKTSKILIDLKKEWLNSPFVPNKLSITYWKRFKAASNIFFRERQKYYTKIKKQDKNNIKQKQNILNRDIEIDKFKDNPNKVKLAKQQIQDEINKIEKTILQYENNLSFLNDSRQSFTKDIKKRITSSKLKSIKLKEKLSVLNRI